MIRRVLVVLAAAASLLAGPAVADDCTYRDLHGKFELTSDCSGLQDHSGIGQVQKRLWLAGPWGELQIIEVPDPHRAADLDFVMSNLGRVWSPQRTPVPPAKTTVGGQDARVVTERKMRTTSRSWVFRWDETNVIVRAVAYGKRAEREGKLESMAKVVETFRATTPG
jgi:hypothetical protein